MSREMTDRSERASDESTSALSTLIPKEIAEILGKPPLVRGESIEEYLRLFARLAAELEPVDAIEWLWLRDIVDREWEARRLRLTKSKLVDIGMELAAIDLLWHRLTPKKVVWTNDEPEKLKAEAKQIFVKSVAGDPQAQRKLRETLALTGLDETAIVAEAVRRMSRTNPAIDQTIFANEQRRDRLIRDISDRHAQRRRQGGIANTTQVIDDVPVTQVNAR